MNALLAVNAADSSLAVVVSHQGASFFGHANTIVRDSFAPDLAFKFQDRVMR